MKKEVRKILSKYVKYIYINSSYVNGFFGDELELILKKYPKDKQVFENLKKELLEYTKGAGKIYIRDNGKIIFW